VGRQPRPEQDHRHTDTGSHTERLVEHEHADRRSDCRIDVRDDGSARRARHIDQVEVEIQSECRAGDAQRCNGGERQRRRDMIRRGQRGERQQQDRSDDQARGHCAKLVDIR